MRIVAGCDGGGTKCDVRMVVCDDGGAILRTAQATSGPANVKSNPELALRNIQTATREAMRTARVSADAKIESFVLALAGAGDSDQQQDWQTILQESLPVHHARVVPDATVLFAAADVDGTLSDQAIAVVVGTGSIAWARDRGGRVKRAGGLGPVMGDEGSGYWIGREAIRRLTVRGNSSPTLMKLAQRFRSRFPGRDLTELAHDADFGSFHQHDIATLCKDVFDAAPTDELVHEIIAAAADHIANLLTEVASGSQTFDTTPVCWLCAGGVAVNQPAWLRTVREKCAKADLILGMPILIPEPVLGATKLALQAVTNP